MKFRLTYEGPLPAASHSNTRAKDKHRIRQVFHPQLRRLWQVHPILNMLKAFNDKKETVPLVEILASEFERNEYKFVPLVCRTNHMVCKISILFLRPEQPGRELIQSGDIDNRLKIIFDALRMPSGPDEIGNVPPKEDQVPFFCLLEDDSLINSIELETDLMLQEVDGSHAVSDVRLIITVETMRSSAAYGSLLF